MLPDVAPNVTRFPAAQRYSTGTCRTFQARPSVLVYAARMVSAAIIVMTLMAADLGWLAGCWEETRGSRRVTEQWTAPDGGTLMGVGRTVEGGTTVEYEFLPID